MQANEKPLSRTQSASIINTKIHNIRVESLRHARNQKHLPLADLTTRHTHNSPTLPANLLADATYTQEVISRRPRDAREALFVIKRVDRPQHEPTATITSTSTWRAEALSLTIPAIEEPQNVPPLTSLCLQILRMAPFDADFSENILPFIPPHLRRTLLRWSAVHAPLTTHQLRALCSSDGDVAGELIVVGPDAGLREDQFKHPDADSCLAEWESEDWVAPPPMHTFILVSSHLAVSVMCTLPATLTHLALVNVSNPVSLHRLPTICPLVESLDLSYNTWLVAEAEARERLGKVQWSRWHQLRILGIRGCHVPTAIVVEVNKGRWDDVQVVK
ncbi:hypothetical protein C8F04DRAFT_213816 [Mycena alexandri]|uniref:Uncharacterized protein n=1 Tax=Mycena alexandri TaxID=1745969 RepID=A0AAD6TIU0_9AGAR|nr:hypothetical protein C8F04DRAFT_213816 [Mycena alexandri]